MDCTRTLGAHEKKCRPTATTAWVESSPIHMHDMHTGHTSQSTCIVPIHIYCTPHDWESFVCHRLRLAAKQHARRQVPARRVPASDSAKETPCSGLNSSGINSLSCTCARRCCRGACCRPTKGCCSSTRSRSSRPPATSPTSERATARAGRGARVPSGPQSIWRRTCSMVLV